jgi:hypothetical protein
MAFPFEEKGKNLQDAVILRSVCEICKLRDFRTAAFVSKNKKVSRSGAVRRFGATYDVSLTRKPAVPYVG